MPRHSGGTASARSARIDLWAKGRHSEYPVHTVRHRDGSYVVTLTGLRARPAKTSVQNISGLCQGLGWPVCGSLTVWPIDSKR
jgi:hypothetical protein